ncbi:MAG: hypothetical protein KAT68_17935 [Bacteroidales bacterium]|nr:hypothetical protein [Bacteroidales bacterium]
MTQRRSRFFSTSITKDQAKDSGMAIVLILMLIGFFAKDDLFYRIAIPVLLMNMIFPMFYYPFSILWFGLSNLLGTIVSKILVSVVFFIIVIPVALLRRLFGKDSLLLKKFKKSSESVMKTRNQTYVVTDLEKPF